MSKYNELLKEKNELTARISQIDKEIEKYETQEIIDNIENIITCLKNIIEIDPATLIEIEVFCEECERDFDRAIDLYEILDSFSNLRNGL